MPRSPQNIPTPPQRSQPALKASGRTRNAPDRRRDLVSRFSEALKRLGISPNSRVALAVSGGGDSVALLLLCADWSKREGGIPPAVLIVDHGLRAQSHEEAARVASWAKVEGLKAHVLTWEGEKPKSGIEEQARAARYRLLGAWCTAHGTSRLLVAHTSGDEAETFLLRLGRGSGVDGLSAMRPKVPFPVPEFASVQIVRPLLDFSRAELRAYLKARGAPWLEDPMNEDVRFARARIRKVLPTLEAAGISEGRIVKAARHLARARQALEEATADFLARHSEMRGDSALLDAAALSNIPREIGLRALSTVLMRISGAIYRPRFESLEELFGAINAGRFRGRTLSGCRIAPAPQAHAALGSGTLLVSRERPRKSAGPKARANAKALREFTAPIAR